MSDKEKTGKKQGEMSFLDHLEELRWHLIRSVLAVMVMAVLAFVFQDFIFTEIIFKPKNPEFWTNRMFSLLADFIGTDALKINQSDLQLISIKMAGQFLTSIWAAIILGFIGASPVVFFEFWLFIKPALYETEKKYASGAVFFTTILFGLGVLFGYYLIVPLSIHFLASYSISGEVVNQININSYISTVASISLASGVVFLLPIFVFFLSRVGLLTPSFMKKYRRHAYVLMLLLSAIITPPDVFSQIMVAFPLVFLYEIGIFISKRVEKRRAKELDD
jgi:sec-independent protein translocase protein TatC